MGYNERIGQIVKYPIHTPDNSQLSLLFPADSQTELSGPKVVPVVKWAGGKQALAPLLAKFVPRNFSTYYEPFIGGASMLLALNPKHAVIGDMNEWLIDTYEAIRDDYSKVIVELDKLKNTREEFLRIRSIDPYTIDIYKSAAQFIYLNKTCFRGLFRVNAKGQFNVPYGEYDRRYYDPENFQRFSCRLQNVIFRRGDFEVIISDIQKNDFVYFDPPYYKLGGYSDFNRYTRCQFREGDHMRLAALCNDLDARGIQWAVSNSDTPFIRRIFEGYNFQSVAARREINLKSEKRDIAELLIRNFS